MTRPIKLLLLASAFVTFLAAMYLLQLPDPPPPSSTQGAPPQITLLEHNSNCTRVRVQTATSDTYLFTPCPVPTIPTQGQPR